MGESSRKFSLQESLPSGTKAALISALLTIHSSFYHSADRLLLTLHKSFTVTEAEECWGNRAWRIREHCWKVVSVCTLSISVIFAHFPKHRVPFFCSCAFLCFALACLKKCGKTAYLLNGRSPWLVACVGSDTLTASWLWKEFTPIMPAWTELLAKPGSWLWLRGTL